jgi:putative nucleotidyltransferase with HDIG domain
MNSDILQKELDEFLDSLNYLPPLKPVPAKILKFLKSSDINIKKLSKLIEKDPSLTTNILKHCNSPYYGFTSKISSINHAISLIGINEVKKLTLIYAVRSRFKNNLEGYGISGEQVFRHSLNTAIGAQFLARLKRIHPIDMAFTAGILIDIGKIALNEFIVKYDIKEFKDKNNIPRLHEIEKQLLGLTHSEIAAILLHKWEFSDDITDAIANHHYPSQANFNRKLSSILHVSDLIGIFNEYSFDITEYETTFDPFALQSLNLKFHDIKDLMDIMLEEMENPEFYI